MNKKTLIEITGRDRPGITAKLTETIAKHELNILDMGQSVLQGLLSLSAIIEGSKEQNANCIKDLLFESKSQGFNLEFKDFVEQEKQVTTNSFIITCIANNHTISSSFIFQITNYLADNNLNIQDIVNKSNQLNILELRVTINEDSNFTKIKTEIIDIASNFKVDISVVKDNVFRFNKRLIIFDMDSTLIQTEVIEELSKIVGSQNEVIKITELAMNGEIDFEESLRKRVSTLKGITPKDIIKIQESLPLTQGVHKFIKIVKSLGLKVGVISGGFTPFTNYLKDKLKLDYAFANNLAVDNTGKLTGELEGTIIDANQKATLLELIAQQESISLEQVVAIGDGANDLPMLSKAGMGIAFHAKKVVQEQSEHHINYNKMDSLHTFLGIPEEYSNKF